MAQAACYEAWTDSGADPAALTVFPCPRVGLAEVRNRLLPLCRGEILLSLNDDVLASPNLLEAHFAAHQQAQRTITVSGYSPWVVHAPDRIFDRLLRETGMVFFYHTMMDANSQPTQPAEHDWGFRHAWGLNMSMPLRVVRQLGGFSVYPAKYGYEDIEMAYRMHIACAAPVRFCPDAVAQHDHRMDPAEYFSREYKLGYASPGFALQSPQCAQALFRRDLLSHKEVAFARDAVEKDQAQIPVQYAAFENVALQPSQHLDTHSPHWSATLRDALYQQHLPIKRFMFRAGLLDAIDGYSCSPERILNSIKALVPA